MSKRSKTKILFDAGPLVNGQKSGVGYYTYGLIDALAKTYPDDVELVGHYFNFLGRKQNLALPTASNIRYRKTVLYPGKIPNALRRIGITLPFELFFKERGDFHLFTNFLGWPSLFKTPGATTIHDLSYKDHPEYVSQQNRQDLDKFVPTSIKRSAFLITISETTKSKIQKYYPDTSKDIVVEHIPPTSKTQVDKGSAEKILNKLGIRGSYLLFVGTIEPRKNIVGLLRAYENLSEDVQKKYDLVLAGGKGWHDEEILSTLSEFKAKNIDVIQTGYISDEERAALYSKASACLLLSHDEGFGMTVLEAMSYGVPVVLSDIPVLHEAAGDAAVYCDQNNPADIANKITDLLDDKHLQSKNTELGSKRVAELSWDKVARNIFDKIQTAYKYFGNP